MALKVSTHTHLSAHHGDFENFAEMMVQTHHGRFDSVFWGFVDKFKPESVKSVVDLGTGPGLLLPQLKEAFVEADVIGVEAQPSMLQRAKKQEGDGIRLIAHDLATPNIPGIESGSVDVAVAGVLLHEMQVPTVLIDEIARILRPGGVLFLIDWVRQPLSTYSDGERPTKLGQFNHFSEHCRYTPEDLAWLFESSGFKIPEWIARKNGRFILLAAVRDEVDAP